MVKSPRLGDLPPLEAIQYLSVNSIGNFIAIQTTVIERSRLGTVKFPPILAPRTRFERLLKLYSYIMCTLLYVGDVVLPITDRFS